MKTQILSLLALLSLTYATAQNIQLELVQNGFTSPLNLQHAGDDRLFIVEQPGKIKILNPDTSVNTTPFIDVASEINGGGEKGLLGLAFHPNYTTNGFFYVYYINNSDDSEIVRYTVSSNPDVADTSTKLSILTFNQPFSNHNGGDIKFGTDGYLYIASGDGGSANDPQNNSQNKSNLLGNLLRIDVDNPSNGLNYGIPSDNPFANATNSDRKEIWAYGLRNPWKFSWDSATNELWIADVGQNAIEEINKAPGNSAGLNYGWRCYEGTNSFNSNGCPADNTLTFPFAEYLHPLGVSITGGYVYRGPAFPDLQGFYFFSDFATSIIGTVNASGTLVSLGNFNNGNWSSFGVDQNNELYILDFNGSIYRIESSNTASTDDFSRSNFTLFPNPATQQFSVQVSNDTMDQILISDLHGRVIHRVSAIGMTTTEISTRNFESGLYLVTIQTQNGVTKSEKLLIQR